MRVRKNGFTIGRLIAFLIFGTFPALCAYLGIQKALDGAIFNAGFIVTFGVLPLGALLLLALVYFNRMRGIFKFLLTIPINLGFTTLFVVGVLLTPFESFNHYTMREVPTSYPSVCEKFEPMPSLEDTGLYGDAHHFHLEKTAVFDLINTTSDILVLQYRMDDYELEKEKLLDRYALETDEEVVLAGSTVATTALIGNYEFALLDTDDFYDFELDFPLRHMIIGYNDKECKIVYIAYDNETVLTVDSLNEFILEECGFEYAKDVR